MLETVILIPTYNERENISYIVPEIFKRHPDVRILVIDDNSPDGTAGAVKDMTARYPALSLLSRAKKEGLGAAYRHGIRYAKDTFDPDRIIMMDADGSHDPKYLAAILKASETVDFVLGSRYVPGGQIENWVLWRKILSRGGNFYARILTGLPLNDMTAGFLCMQRDVLKRLNLDHVSASGYAFLIDLKFHIIRDLGASFQEVPITLPSRREGESKISTHIIREGLTTPWRLFFRRLRPRTS